MKRKFDKLGAAYEVYKNRKSLWGMLKDVKSGKHKLSVFSYVAAFLALLYTVSPVDVLPDFIPVLGWIDDGVVWLLVLQQLRKELNRYNESLEKEAKWEIVQP